MHCDAERAGTTSGFGAENFLEKVAPVVKGLLQTKTGTRPDEEVDASRQGESGHGVRGRW